MFVQSTKPTAFLPLQVLISYDFYYTFISFLIAALMYVFKTFDLDYPGSSLAWEIPITLLYPFAQCIRLTLGFRGNKTENSSLTALFIGLTVLCIGWQAIFFLAQTYVLALFSHCNKYRLTIELVVWIVAVVFSVMELVLALIALIMFVLMAKEL